MSSVKEDLIKARAKIEKGWCKGTEAQNENGRPVPPDSAEAVAFCIFGATPGAALPPLRTALRVRLRRPPWDPASLADYNDRPWRTKDEVLSLFDEAIALVEKDE